MRLAHRLTVARHAVERPFEPEYALLPALVGRRDTAVDVGGHSGWYAGRLAQLARRVVVFEPNAALAEALAVRLPRACRVEPVALSDRDVDDAVLLVPLDPDGTPGTNLGHVAGAQPLPADAARVALPTRLRRLDRYAAGLRRVSLIKIDVEGHERAVILGARGLIRRERPRLIVEIEHRHDPDCAATFALLAELGYGGFAVVGGRLERADAGAVMRQTPQGYALRMRGGPAQAYVNNFVFLHRNDEARRLPALRAILRASSKARG